jgi:hypothetical protein
MQVFTVSPGTGGDPRKLFHNLNSDPNFRGITNARHDANLPESWKLSFGRVAPQPLRGDTGWFHNLTVTAFNDFERACGRLLSAQGGRQVRSQILAGVTTNDKTRRVYLGHTEAFSVRRLDIVINQDGATVCENDEMPGGLVHAYWLDRAYGINQRRWDQALRWLTQNGPLVFAVSTEWSAPYLHEITWFVQHLVQRGFDVHLVTSNDANRLKVGWRGAFLDGRKIATVWRLFPIFEAQGAFAPIVKAASQGKIRLVPELASWGNKAWMGVFWEQRDYFRRTMNPRAFHQLSQLIPYTRLVTASGGYPSAIRDKNELVRIDSFDALKGIPTRQRKQVVLKMAGAHNRAARSHGVVIGTSATGTRWAEALDQMVKLGAPLIVQEYRSPRRVDVPIWSVLNGQPELENPFTGKMLIRPWMIGGQLVSATAFLSVPNTAKLHGTTTGAEVPLNFG